MLIDRPSSSSGRVHHHTWRRAVALAAVGLAVAAGCGSAPLPRFGTLDTAPRRFTVKNDLVLFAVSNGLTVALAPDPRTNLVSVDVRYLVGASADPAGRTGMAHLVEHLSFQADAGGAGGTIFDQMSAQALSFNAYTNHDVTHYLSTALADRLDTLLDLEARRMEARCDRLDDALFARERDVVLAEEAERHTPLTEVRQQVATEIWGGGHPYGRAVGSREVASATKAEACAFFAAHYGPGNAVMVVTGNFEPAQLQARIGRRFGPIARTAVSPSPAPVAATFAGEDRELAADLDHPVVQIYLRAPAWGADDEATHEMVMAAFAGELAAFDREHDWVIDAGVGYDGDGWQRATVVSVAVTEPGRIPAAVDEVLRRGRDLYILHSSRAREGLMRRIAALRGRLQTATVTRFDAIAGRGDWLADYLTYTRHNEFAVARMRALDTTTLTGLSNHAQRLFDRRRAHVVRLLPSGESKAASTAITSVGGRTYDLVPWRAEVDPTEAGRPLELPKIARIPIGDETLPNGLRVLTFHDATSPIVVNRLVYPVGTIDDAPGRSGVASLAAYLLDHDLDRTYPDPVVYMLIYAFGLGTVVSAEVGDSATVFSTGGLAAYGDWHLWRLAWLLEQGVYPADELRAARQNLREGGDDDVSPSGAMFRERLFGRGHPYATPPATVAQLAAISGGQLAAWRRARYVPDGATLIVTGGYDRTTMDQTIVELFGPWPRRPAAVRAPVPTPRPAPGPTWLGVRKPTATQVKLYVSFTARSTPGDDRAARMVLAEMLTDRLRLVREGMGASYGVSAGYDSGAAGSALDVVTGLDPVRAPEAATAIMEELRALQLDAAARPEAFARARRRVLAGLLASQRDAATVADELERLVRNQLGIEQLQKLPAQVANLSLADIATLAAADLDRSRMVVSVDGPAAPAAATLTALGATDPTWFDE